MSFSSIYCPALLTTLMLACGHLLGTLIFLALNAYGKYRLATVTLDTYYSLCVTFHIKQSLMAVWTLHLYDIVCRFFL